MGIHAQQSWEQANISAAVINTNPVLTGIPTTEYLSYSPYINQPLTTRDANDFVDALPGKFPTACFAKLTNQGIPNNYAWDTRNVVTLDNKFYESGVTGLVLLNGKVTNYSSTTRLFFVTYKMVTSGATSNMCLYARLEYTDAGGGKAYYANCAFEPINSGVNTKQGAAVIAMAPGSNVALIAAAEYTSTTVIGDSTGYPTQLTFTLLNQPQVTNYGVNVLQDGGTTIKTVNVNNSGTVVVTGG